MGRSQETFNKKEVRSRKEKKRKEKEKKRLAKKESGNEGGQDDMIAYVDEHGNITSTPPDPTQKEEIEAEDIEVSVPKTDNSFKDDPSKTGTITYFNDSKGFGFITESMTKQSIFFHVNDTLEDVKEGNLVSFEVGAGQKGPAAMKVKLVK